jgi:3'(2'), 5'-bisphosphate nucleotidase
MLSHCSLTGSMPSTESDGQLATRLATQAGNLLSELREKMFAAGASTWDVKDAGDAIAQRFLAQEFATHRPDDAELSEEGREDPRRFGADRVWIVDPLDGTREFSEPGRIDWAVHIALWTGDGFGAAAVSLCRRSGGPSRPTPPPRWTLPRPRAWRSRQDSTSAVSTDRRSSTTPVTRGSPTSSCAGPSWRRPC